MGKELTRGLTNVAITFWPPLVDSDELVTAG